MCFVIAAFPGYIHLYFTIYLTPNSKQQQPSRIGHFYASQIWSLQRVGTENGPVIFKRENYMTSH